MNIEERNKSSKPYNNFKATMHLTMGVLYVVIGSTVLYIKYFGAFELPAATAYFLGSMMIIYGLFRIWRGWQGLRPKRKSLKDDFPSLSQTMETNDK